MKQKAVSVTLPKLRENQEKFADMISRLAANSPTPPVGVPGKRKSYKFEARFTSKGSTIVVRLHAGVDVYGGKTYGCMYGLNSRSFRGDNPGTLWRLLDWRSYP